MKKTEQPAPKTDSNPTPDLATLMHMGLYIPTEINPELLTEQGQELAGLKTDK
jgi:hypothetical protein